MKIYLMTDMEGVAGVMNHDDWCLPSSPYYEEGKTFLTLETNAAVAGFFSAGADEVVVSDGHGAGGINIGLLDKRAKLLRGYPTGYPLLMDETYDAIGWVGQHAKSRTEFSHITHTQSFNVFDLVVNGVSIGELGQTGLSALELGIPAIFASGEKALCDEAEALFPGIVTAAVKWGQTPGSGDECNADQYAVRNLSAIHLQPEQAREVIYEAAYKSLKTFINGNIPIKSFPAPYHAELTYRANSDHPKRRAIIQHDSSFIALMNSLHSKPFEPCE